MTIRPRGVYAAAITPLTATYDVDVPRFVAHCQWLLANGCDGLAPLGTTGEANSLSAAQRQRLVEGMAKAGLDMSAMIIGAGACALADAIANVKASLALGCANVLMLPPWYYKNPSEDGLHDFFARLIDGVNDAKLRLYLYHFPQLSAVPITAGLIDRLRKSHGTTVIAGLKDSSGDWNNSKMLIETFPGFDVFSGTEHYLAQNLATGGVGCISATTNVTAPLAARVLKTQGAAREDVQKGLSELRLAIQAFPLISALKHIKARLAGDPAWDRPMPPNVKLSEAQAADLMAKLAATRDFAMVADTLRKAA